MKKLHMLIFPLLILITMLTLTACSVKQKYVNLDIHSAEDDVLLKTIDDSEILKEISKNIAMGETDLYTDTESVPDNEKAEYYFIFYEKLDSGEVVESITLTIYEDSDFILDEFPVDSGNVIYRSSKVVQYLRTLI